MSTLTLRLHDGPCVQDVHVDSRDMVQVLEKLATGTDRRFIMHKGKLLMTSFSFQFYNIKDGDNIYILRGKQRQETKTKQQAKDKRMKRDFLVQCDKTHEQDLAREATRLIDLVAMQIDGNENVYRHYARIAKINAERDSQDKIQLTEECVSLQEPSKDMLPVFWGRNLRKQYR